MPALLFRWLSEEFSLTLSFDEGGDDDDDVEILILVAVVGEGKVSSSEGFDFFLLRSANELDLKSSGVWHLI